ncbi:transketolase [Vibrio spartinae]|uniref:Ferredoxin fas2 n=1 Tax=Vibrio spartinae TaxID=1918945 RepID=A0ABX6QUP9_9VIBR|nr:transketolase [Vibrio spartinae]QMV12974.1 Ferredoxin fas2 [Vibrio spartinae]
MDSISLARKVREHSVKMVHRGRSSHIGSALSIVDILAVLYTDVLNISLETVNDPERDIFILSKGHAGASLYATLAERGFFPISDLDQHYQNGSLYSGHVSHKGIPGVEFSTGSLGHGLPVAVGIALAAKLDGLKNKVFVLLGDGEILEGSNWESLAFASHHKLDNLCIIIDRNNLQSFKSTEATIALEPMVDKFLAFGVGCQRVHGHDHTKLKAEFSSMEDDRPKVIIADTIKGKGISYMENQVLWHYKYPDEEQLKLALEEISGGMSES